MIWRHFPHAMYRNDVATFTGSKAALLEPRARGREEVRPALALALSLDVFAGSLVYGAVLQDVHVTKDT